MNACSIDLRKRVVGYVQAGHTHQEASEHFFINVSSVYRWMKLLRETGSLEVKPTPRSPHRLYLEPLKKYVDEHPDSYIWDIAEYFKCGKTTVFHALRKLGYFRKKNKKFIANRTHRRGKFLWSH